MNKLNKKILIMDSKKLLISTYTIIVCIISLLLIFFLELSYFQFDLKLTYNWIIVNWQLYFMSCFIIMISIIFLLCIINNSGLSILIPSILIVLISYINYLKIYYRGVPLYFDELKLVFQINSLIQMITFAQLLFFLIAFLVFIILSILCVFFTPKIQIKIQNKLLLGFICFIILSIIFTYSKNFINLRKLIALSICTFMQLQVINFLGKRYKNSKIISLLIFLFSFIIPFCLLLYLKFTNVVIIFLYAIIITFLSILLYYSYLPKCFLNKRIFLKKLLYLKEGNCELSSWQNCSFFNFVKKIFKTEKCALFSIVLCSIILILIKLTIKNPFYSFVALYSEYPDGHFSGYDYNTSGVLCAFIRSMNVNDIMTMPNNYSSDKVKTIISEYTQKAALINEGRTGFSKKKPNIIFIMSEAFSDPNSFEQFVYNVDPIPYTHNLLNIIPSGKALVNVYGGGTVLPEFQALTGFYTWFNEGDMYSYISAMNQFPSFVSFLKGQRYRTTAIHPHFKTFYRRDSAYNVLGFDEFLSRETMSNQHKNNNGYISDWAAFNEVLDILNNNSNQFIHLVTMQNHGPYPIDLYEDIDITVTGDINESILDNVKNYSKGLKFSDDALYGFLSQVQLLEKPTIVLFWGDHLPVAYSINFFSENGYIREKYETPMFIFANFPLEFCQFGSISPMFFENILLDLMNMKISPFHALLNELMQKVHGVCEDWYIDNNNIMHKQSEWDEETKKIIEKLEIIEYDIFNDSQSSYKEGFFDVLK